MKTTRILFYVLVSSIAIGCASNTENKVSKEEIKEEQKTIESGVDEVNQLLTYLQQQKIQVGHTSTTELSELFGIEANDYYMNKKIELEDHTLYITFTISKNILTRISYATLSKSPKDFSYIDNVVELNFGDSPTIEFLTSDSVMNNSLRTWNLDSLKIVYQTFSDLNSGYELIIQN